MAKSRIVAVFGGSSPQPGDPAYAEAEEVGRLLAEAGYAVMTGGYSGTMEAASKGAKSAGGKVIGVTVGLFERTEGRRPNDFLDEIVRYDNLRDRLHHLVEKSDAAVALRGGIGTLSEVALTWSLMQVGEISRKPLVLLGEEWGDLLRQFAGWGGYVRDEHLTLFKVARSAREAVALIEAWQ